MQLQENTQQSTQSNPQPVSQFESKERLNRQAMEDTLADLASILYPQSDDFSDYFSDLVLTTNADQALLLAAGAVGKALGITIT